MIFSSDRFLTVYRAGELDSERGLFFADSYDAAWLYSQSSGHPVVAYRVAPARILELESQYAWLSAREGISVAAVMQKKKRSADPYWLRKLDKTIMTSAQNDGYNAIRYRSPTTPNAQWEIVVFDRRDCLKLGECDNMGHIISEGIDSTLDTDIADVSRP